MIGLLNFDKLVYESKDLSDKVSIVTGANIGIGYETAKQLGLLNSKVYLICRNKEKGENAIKKLELETGKKNYKLLIMDLEDFSSIETAANQFSKLESRLHILINNAGLFSESRIVTKDGIERTFQCNYFGPVLFTMLLLPILKVTEGARIVNVSSKAYSYGTYDIENIKGLDKSQKYSMMLFYSTSKLYLNMFSLELAKILSQSNSDILVSTTHPGYVATDMAHKPELKTKLLNRILFAIWTILELLICRTPQQGSITSLHAAVDPEVEQVGSGNYWVDCKVQKLPDEVIKPKLTNELLMKTLVILNLDSNSI